MLPAGWKKEGNITRVAKRVAADAPDSTPFITLTDKISAIQVEVNSNTQHGDISKTGVLYFFSCVQFTVFFPEHMDNFYIFSLFPSLVSA